MLRKNRLNNEPLRLKKKVGLRNEPSIMLVTNTLIRDTQTPMLKSNLKIVYKIIIFAMPGLTPGIGLGKKNSISDNAIAIADNFAI
tara:strand:- start:386 stop:643 length:258 start_codon:yes stop_codon:yes gene_type:complete